MSSCKAVTDSLASAFESSLLWMSHTHAVQAAQAGCRLQHLCFCKSPIRRASSCTRDIQKAAVIGILAVMPTSVDGVWSQLRKQQQHAMRTADLRDVPGIRRTVRTLDRAEDPPPQPAEADISSLKAADNVTEVRGTAAGRLAVKFLLVDEY